MKTISKTYELSAAVCDEIAELVMEFCQEIKTESRDMLRYRLSAEECLLYWMEHGLAGHTVTFQAGRFMTAPYVILEAEGKSLNPYAGDAEEFGTFSGSVLVNLGLNPEYDYVDGRNRIRFRIKKKSPSQIASLLMVLCAAALIGLLGEAVIPADIRMVLLDVIINPLYDTFFKILGCVAGPMIFLSVAWGVYGMGDAATFGRIGKRMMLRFVLTTFLTAAACSVYFTVLGPKLSGGYGGETQFHAISELLFGIIPSNIIEPFESGNTLQIIFMAIVIGIALLYLGRQTSSLANAISQINTLVQFLMQFISMMVPYVIFLVVLSMIWSDEIGVIMTAWKVFAAILSSMILISFVFTAVTSLKMKVHPLLLVRKRIPTFLIALITASSAASFASSVDTCEKKFGINPSLIRFGIPLGMVIHKPIAAAYNLLMVFYFANMYHVSCSLSLVCIAVFMCAVISIATPPIPGGGAIAYSVLFLQLGIPAEAMTVALAIDIITDFFITAFEVFNLPMSLINISSGMGMIDTEILKKEM